MRVAGSGIGGYGTECRTLGHGGQSAWGMARREGLTANGTGWKVKGRANSAFRHLSSDICSLSSGIRLLVASCVFWVARKGHDLLIVGAACSLKTCQYRKQMENLKSRDNDTGNSGYDTKNLKFCDFVF